jgi:esterase/lipase superfamily enzyme
MLRNFYITINIVTLLILLNACSSKHALVPSPNIYIANATYPQHRILKNMQTVKPAILYITDRKIEKVKDKKFAYGTERSTSMAFGEVDVLFGDNLSWKDLTRESALSKREVIINLEVENIKEILRFPSTPVPFNVKNETFSGLSTEQIEYEKKTKEFKKLLSSRLSLSHRKDVVMFVHGFSNTFDDAALSLSDIWHFSDRMGVPLLYSWPAGNEGLFSYFVDRESGEFTIFHFKETIKMIANTPGVERIHIIAHSRGTDVVTTGLRELVIAQRAAGKDPRKSLKIENLILAAPDLDFGVVSQRLIAEKFGLAFNQITVYINKDDSALNISQYLMSGTRFGRIGSKDLSENEKKVFARVKNVNFINVEDVSGLIGHAYFRKNPGVLSDISIILNNSSFPGGKKRPLENISGNFWLLKNDYLFNLVENNPPAIGSIQYHP